MLVSVIVPIYNVESYLRRCLDGLKSQTLESIEFVCVDDGSTDGSLDILRSYASSDDRFRIIAKSNSGYGHTINRGINAARGEYVGVVESDDFCDAEMFERLYDLAQAHELDIVRSSYYRYWSLPSERIEYVPSAPEEACGIVFDPRAYKSCFLFHPALWSMLVKRNIIESNNLRLLETPGASYQDTSFSFKLWACCSRAMVLRDAYLYYRQDNESSSINQPGKLQYVPREYQEIERFVLSDKQRFGELLEIMEKRKFSAYIWNYDRLATELHFEFARMASLEFQESFVGGSLNKDLYSSDEWSDLVLLSRDPEKFVYLRDSASELSKRVHYVAERIRRVFCQGR